MASIQNVEGMVAATCVLAVPETAARAASVKLAFESATDVAEGR